MLLPPHIFPSIAWFLHGMQAGKFTVGMGGNFVKQTHRSRYEIAGPNLVQKLIVPVVHPAERSGTARLLAETEISYAEKWVKEHLHAIKSAYGKAPFFEFYDYKTLPVISAENKKLSDMVVASIRALHGTLVPEIPLEFTDDLAPDLPEMRVPEYPQVFEEKFGFRAEVSALDLLYNLGPEAWDYLISSRH